jgi:diacylglycerol O-acyltransferase
MKAIRAVLGGSVNDVALAAVTAAFRAQLLMRHDGVAPGAVMRALVPVSRRAEGDRTTNNQVSFMVAELPIGCADPLERLSSISSQMAELKRSHQVESAAAAFDAAALVPPVIVSATVKTAMAAMHWVPQRMVHTVVTNVPGPQHPLYAMGREMVEYLPFVPAGEGIRIGVAILSYNGHVAFGLTGDLASVPELRSMAEQIESEVTELVRLAAMTRT